MSAERRLRIAYLVNIHPMPSTTFVRREIAALEELGHEVDRYTVRRFGELVDPLDQAEEAQTRCILQQGGLGLLAGMLAVLFGRPRKFLAALELTLRIRKRSPRGLMVHLAYLAEACVLVRWLAARPVNHLHVHFGTNSAAVAMICRVLGGPPYSVTVHGPEEFDGASVLVFDEKIAHSAFFVAISEFSRSQLMRWCDPQDWPKLNVVRCGIDDAFLAEPESDIPDVPRLVCIGRLSRQKGQVFLAQAAARLHAEGVVFQLVLVGEGETRAQIEAVIAEHGLEDVILLTGVATNEEVRAHLLDSRALILPSFAEGLPVVIMEALALGRPVLSTYVAGIPELVVDGESGWLVPAGAVTPLAAAMREVLETPAAELQRRGRRGAEMVREQHDIRRIAAQLVELIEASRSRNF